MKVGIVGGDPCNQAHLKKVDQMLEQLIEESGTYLFTIFSAGIKGSIHTGPSLAQQYSALRGTPLKRKEYTSFDKLVKGICEEVDYLIILNDKSQSIKRLFMSYKQTGKHGSMIEL
jgi:hypothetical protein